MVDAGALIKAAEISIEEEPVLTVKNTQTEDTVSAAFQGSKHFTQKPDEATELFASLRQDIIIEIQKFMGTSVAEPQIGLPDETSATIGYSLFSLSELSEEGLQIVLEDYDLSSTLQQELFTQLLAPESEAYEQTWEVLSAQNFDYLRYRQLCVDNFIIYADVDFYETDGLVILDWLRRVTTKS